MKTLSDFVTQQSMHLFTVRKLNQDLLFLDPETWNRREDYRNARDNVASLHVLDDFAERAVTLATGFNLAMTQDEE